MSSHKFNQQKPTKLFKRRKTHKNIGHLKICNWPHTSFPLLQPILCWNVADSPLSSDHSLITVSVRSKNFEPQTPTTKFNINNVNGLLFSSFETWKRNTNPYRSQNAEAIIESFYKKKKSSKSAILVLK